MLLALPQGVDAGGRIYAVYSGMGEDSASIARIDRSEGMADLLARVKRGEVTVQESGGANDRNVMMVPIPLSPEDAWGVSADGSIVIARSSDYHVEWIDADSVVTIGAPFDYESVRLRTPEKEEFLARQGRTGGGIGMGVTLENGRRTVMFRRGSGDRQELDSYPWPDVKKPPFYAGRLEVDPHGHVWVRRHVPAGEANT